MITPEDEHIFEEVMRTGDLDVFTEHYFRLPWSGTWFTPEDRPEQYEDLHRLWTAMGKPDDQFSALLDDQEVELKIMWDTHYGEYPMILLPHGFRSLPWIRELISPQIGLAIAVTGTGSGKTCSVAIAALTYCALYPGFRFLNVAPTGAQAALMLGEIEKWCANTAFRKFIKPSRGAHELWMEKPYPTITIEVYPGFPSTFVCQTVGRDARNIIGGEQDWINCDESQLLTNIDAAKPIFVTRLRGTRVTGVLRWGKLTWITNPGANPELVSLMEEYRALIEKGAGDVLVMEDIDSSANIYLTRHQLEKQARTMSSRVEDRWHGGSMAAAFAGLGIDEALLELCRDEELEAFAERFGGHDDEVGLRRYELPYELDHDYIVAGDAGKGSVSSLSTMNIPVCGVFDVTNFLERPGTCRLVAFDWHDGLGSYTTFIDVMKRYMLRYRAKGFYDAGNVQTAFEDLEGGFKGWPTMPIFFGGTVSAKAWALTILTQLMDEQIFAWPYIKGLWHQARIYNPSSRKQADDIVAMLLVFCLVLRTMNAFWYPLRDRFGWREEGEEETEDPETEDTYTEEDRHARFARDR